jgi:hypothetical protein
VGSLKVAHFTVHATAEQSARWNRAAEGEGHRAAGTWLAAAADAYLKARARAGAPVPLAWHRRRFSVFLEGGEEVSVNGHVSPPFGSFSGTEEGPAAYAGRRRHVLVYLPSKRVLATLKSYGQCKALAAELARTWVRWDGAGREPPGQDPAPILWRYKSEDV